MGAQFSKSKTHNHQPQILFVGPDRCGKSTLRHHLTSGNVASSDHVQAHELPTLDGGEIELWEDVNDTRSKTRPLLQLYFARQDGFVFVIDSTDEPGSDEALRLLNDLLFTDKRTRLKVLMVLANKQDLDGALPLEKIEEKMKETVSAQGRTVGGRYVFVKGCSAKTGEGVQEAFSHFLELLRLRKTGKVTPGFRTLHLFQKDKHDDYSVEGKDKKEKHLNYLRKLYNVTPFVKSILCY